MDDERLLTVRRLAIFFGKIPVVRDVSFDLRAGEILALVGESGCGKSISCLSLAGLLGRGARPVAEEMRYRRKNGEIVDLLHTPVRHLREIRGGEIAYVFQEPAAALNPVFRIGDQIEEVLELHRPEISDRRREVLSLLSAVGIPAPESRIDAFPHELSGGMQQRVMIAMALAGNPRLLIADEPTTALDVTIQAQILELLDRLRRERGMAVLLVTHNLGIVSQLADRVCVMYAGDAVERGACRDVIDSPLHPYTRALLRAVPVPGAPQGKLATIKGSVPSSSDFPAGCRFFGRCPLEETLSEADQERCRTQIPVPREAGNRFCRCHFAGTAEK
ncbi:MAG: ABC transporter ATP-binding protein [Victivallaceae bacterium]|nr:ABC transporter ATP-binding protein [Victivallaceae bacterium]